jgi:acetyl esterase/lipase
MEEVGQLFEAVAMPHRSDCILTPPVCFTTGVRWLVVALGLGGLGCAGVAWAALAVTVVPRLPPRLAYYGHLAVGSAPGLAAVGIAGCALCAPGALLTGRLRWLAWIGLGISGVSAGVFAAVTASTVMVARANGLRVAVNHVGRVAPPDAPGFDTVTIGEGLDWRQDADVYLPGDDRALAQPRPAILVIHGGAWIGGDKGENRAWNRWLARRGFVVVDLQYRLAPRAGWREAVSDIEQGVAWVREHSADLGVDPDRLSLLGRSAGGHLALLAAYTTNARPPSSVVALYGPTDLGRLHAHNRGLRPALEALMGNTPSDAPGEYRLASPIARAHRAAPPTLLIHGAWDDSPSADHSRLLAHELDRLGVPHQLMQVPYARHAFDIDAGGLASQVAIEAVSRFCLRPLASA